MRILDLRLLAVFAASVLGSALFAACGGSDDAANDIEVTATDFRFTPAEIRVTAGERYDLRLRNESQLLHDWTVDRIPVSNVRSDASAEHNMAGTGALGSDGMDAELHVVADGRKSATLSFTPTEPGRYAFYCTAPGHRTAGMEGTLIVES